MSPTIVGTCLMIYLTIKLLRVKIKSLKIEQVS